LTGTVQPSTASSPHGASGKSLDVIPVLLYHSVPRAETTRDALSVPVPLFRNHLEVIADAGRTPVGIRAVASALRGESSLPDRPVAITFDDAYADTPEAVELTVSYGLSASVFVTTGQVGSGSMIRRDQLERLAARPDQVELGAHTVSHPFLDELDAHEVEWEIGASKAALEGIIGRKVSCFAYPFGAYSQDVRAAVVAAGFELAAAVKNAISHPADDPFAIARWTVGRATSPRQLERVLEGEGAPRAWQNERLRTRAYRGARRWRRRLTRLGGRA
jgi:peptidoglycan/xylan/chitin deacetylase (PgdA/CDA1 family)